MPHRDRPKAQDAVTPQPQALLCSDSQARANGAGHRAGTPARAALRTSFRRRMACPVTHAQQSIYQDLIKKLSQVRATTGSLLEAWKTSVQPSKSGCGPTDRTPRRRRSALGLPHPGESLLIPGGNLASTLASFLDSPAKPQLCPRFKPCPAEFQSLSASPPLSRGN